MSHDPIDAPFWSALLRRVARRTRGRDDAEDLLHTAFIRLERYRAKHIVRNPAAFLIKSAVNVGIDRHRHEQWIADPEGAENLEDFADQSPSCDEVVDGAARLNRVKSGLAQLNPKTRQIFLMHRLDEIKYREIAVRLGLSQSAVEKHIAKAALFLSEWMEGW
jgi:RNA polymerase sigma-70 factor (ECF subfamily)